MLYSQVWKPLPRAGPVPDIVVGVQLIEERSPHAAGFCGALGVVDLGVGAVDAVERRAGIGGRDEAAIGGRAAAGRKHRRQAEQQHRHWPLPGA